MIRGALLTLQLLALAVVFFPGSAHAQEASADTAVPKTQPPRPRQVDSLKLDATVITGNRELPKVLYIVPWKDSDFGDLTGGDHIITDVSRHHLRSHAQKFILRRHFYVLFGHTYFPLGR